MSDKAPGEPDEDDGALRTLVNFLAAIAALVVAIALVLAYQAFERQQKLERCVNSGRRDCLELADPSALTPKPP